MFLLNDNQCNEKTNSINKCKDWLAFEIMQKTHLNNDNKDSSYHILFLLYIVDCGLFCQNSQ